MRRDQPWDMLERTLCRCEALGCERPLTEDRRMLTMETDGGLRHAYECECGAVTVTVATE